MMYAIVRKVVIPARISFRYPVPCRSNSKYRPIVGLSSGHGGAVRFPTGARYRTNSSSAVEAQEVVDGFLVVRRDRARPGPDRLGAEVQVSGRGGPRPWGGRGARRRRSAIPSGTG